MLCGEIVLCGIVREWQSPCRHFLYKTEIGAKKDTEFLCTISCVDFEEIPLDFVGRFFQNQRTSFEYLTVATVHMHHNITYSQ